MALNEYRKLSSLTNWDKNPRSIKKNDFERLKKQIQQLGQYKPLLITDDGIVLGGNMRLRAYKDLGIDDLWVSVVDAKTEDKKLEYALSDNDRAGYYDSDLVANLIPDYPNFEWKDYAIDLKEPKNLGDLVDSFTEAEEDEIPSIAEGEPTSKYGEVYQLGRHRLMCGDATKIEDVEKLMNGQKADMVFTDPPYGVDFERGKFVGRKKAAKGEKYVPILNDELKGDELMNLVEKALANTYSVSKAAPIYVFSHALNEGYAILQAVQSAGYKVQSQIIWRKTPFVIGRSDYHWQHEVCWYGFKEGHPWYGGRDKSTVWDYPKPVKVDLHPTMKPIALCARAVLNSTKGEDIVLDVFGGSGSTLIACEQTNRVCYLMELDPKYCDVIRNRYENYVANKKGSTNG